VPTAMLKPDAARGEARLNWQTDLERQIERA
jgi:hypothetical protein